MNRMLIPAALAAALVSMSGAAGAQARMGFDQRLTGLEQRIDQGARSGALSRSEADSLHVGIARIRLYQAQYRRGGISPDEQSDLDRRFDNLARHVTPDRRDASYQGDRDSRGNGNGNGNYRSNGNSRGNGSYRGNSNYHSGRATYADRSYRSN